MGQVIRYGRRIEVVTLNPNPPAKARRKAFEPRWIKLPRHWISALGRSKNANAYRLALLILWETFKNKQGDGKIVLSAKMTGMPGSIRHRAARELVELGLIVLESRGRKALRASVVPYSLN
jgi:hypothetical protein